MVSSKLSLRVGVIRRVIHRRFAEVHPVRKREFRAYSCQLVSGLTKRSTMIARLEKEETNKHVKLRI